MNRLLAEALADCADWVVPLDVDEFLLGDVPAVLAGFEPGSPVRVPWKTYVPLSSDSLNEPNVLKRIVHRRAAESPQWHKVIVPASAVFKHRAAISFGNHELLDSTGTTLVARDCALALAHYPVRSIDQIKRKVFGGWPANYAFPDRRNGSTFQWQAIYERLKVNDSISTAELTQIALDYATSAQYTERLGWSGAGSPATVSASTPCIVHDPVKCEFALKFAAACVPAQAVLLDNAEAFARAYGDAVGRSC